MYTTCRVLASVPQRSLLVLGADIFALTFHRSDYGAGHRYGAPAHLEWRPTRAEPGPRQQGGPYGQWRSLAQALPRPVAPLVPPLCLSQVAELRLRAAGLLNAPQTRVQLLWKGRVLNDLSPLAELQGRGMPSVRGLPIAYVLFCQARTPLRHALRYIKRWTVRAEDHLRTNR